MPVCYRQLHNRIYHRLVASEDVSAHGRHPQTSRREILKKLDLVTLTRMRKTTTKMNTIAENINNSLMKTNHFLDCMRIEIHSDVNGKLKLVTTVMFNKKITVLSDPVAQLSGVNVKMLAIMWSESLFFKKAANEEMAILPEVVNLLKYLRISPKVLQLPGLYQKFSEGVLAALVAARRIAITGPPEDFEFIEFAQNPVVKHSEQVMVTKMGMTSYEEAKELDIFRMQLVHIYHVKEFIKTVHADPIVHRLRRVDFLVARPPFGWFDVFGDILEDGSLPEIRRFTRNVFLMESETKWIGISEIDDGLISVVFCEKTPGALWKTLVDWMFERIGIRIDVTNYQKEFYEAKNLQEQAAVVDRMFRHNTHSVGMRP